MTDLLNDRPRRTELAQDGFHCITDCADQHWRRERHSQLSCARQANPHARVESKPFFSCRRREDRPGPLSRCFTSSPIHDVSAFGTEPANEALRTADSRREGGITYQKYKHIYHHPGMLSYIIIILVIGGGGGAMRSAGVDIQKQMVLLATTQVITGVSVEHLHL